jgi:hypothetical protein
VNFSSDTFSSNFNNGPRLGFPRPLSSYSTENALRVGLPDATKLVPFPSPAMNC